MKSINPLIPFLTGWITSCIAQDAIQCMKVLHVIPEPPNKIRVEFASGLVLCVEVSEIRPSIV